MPRHASSAGPEAVELAASAGLILDPWQAAVLEDALGERVDGKWAAFQIGLVVPRQNGKGSILEARELAGLYLFGEQLIVHSAHEFKTAAEGFRRILSLIENTDDLRRRVKKVTYSHGEEGIELLSGQRLRFAARTGGSGRGFTGDTVILDEAYNLIATGVSAMVPTMAARPNPQLWLTSSAPLAGPESATLRKLCKRGRAGLSDRLAYLEWCAESDADHENEEAWADANPGIDVRITREFIGDERNTFTEIDDWARERLGIWTETDESADRVISQQLWDEAFTPDSGINGETRFALDISPDRAWSTFSVAGRAGGPDGGVHVEVIDRRAGTRWVVARAKQLVDNWGGSCAIAEKSPAWSLKDDLEAADVPLFPVTVEDHAEACADLLEAIGDGEIHHIDQPSLNAAVSAAEKRSYGEMWLWSRKNSTTDISPLVAVTLAFFSYMQTPEGDADYFVI